jgi:hypothetical protein
MKLSAEPKKLGILIGLLVVAAYLFYSNSTSSEAPARSASPPGATAATPDIPPREPRATGPRIARTATGRSLQEFRPSLKPRKPEERPDPASVDPTLRLELLAKLQTVKLEGGMRSLFEFGQAPPPPKPPEPKILPKTAKRFMGPMPPLPPTPVQPADKQPAPPIPLKFYGYVSPARAGARRAFFLEGDDIFVASEGELIKKRYKVIRIGVNSAIVEDVEHSNQQTLPLVEQAG